MKKAYGKALRSVFSQLMKKDAGAFSETKVDGKYSFPGDRVYRWIANERIHCFIILAPDRGERDAFTIEIGWSTKARFPELSMRPSSKRPSEAFDLEEYICRLPMIYSGSDSWWTIGSLDKLIVSDPAKAVDEMMREIGAAEADAAVKQPLDDAMAKLLQHGIPYLNRFLQNRIGQSNP